MAGRTFGLFGRRNTANKFKVCIYRRDQTPQCMNRISKYLSTGRRLRLRDYNCMIPYYYSSTVRAHAKVINFEREPRGKFLAHLHVERVQQDQKSIGPGYIVYEDSR